MQQSSDADDRLVHPLVQLPTMLYTDPTPFIGKCDVSRPESVLRVDTDDATQSDLAENTTFLDRAAQMLSAADSSYMCV